MSAACSGKGWRGLSSFYRNQFSDINICPNVNLGPLPPPGGGGGGLKGIAAFISLMKSPR